ncbi:MAG: serine hydrolase [Candidatus Spyradocola sp.]|jgi:CubicO group peptidase (beta-lactamase class C family)
MHALDQVKANVEKELKAWDQPSMALGVVKDGKIELCEAFGYADVEAGRKADADTLYQIGSCSKAFTAAAAAVLVDQGKLDWDTPVIEYLPWIRFMDPFTTYHATTRDLLCHRTGLPRHDAYWIDGPCTRREMVENLRNMQPAWSFRSHWCYQNTCFVAVGMLIEELSGMTWEDFVRKYLLEPIGMTRTTFYVDDIAGDPNHAEPYDRPIPTDLTGVVKVPFLKSDREDRAKGIGAPYGPAGSIMSTVTDMLKWVEFNLNNGKVGDKQVVSEANMKELHKPQMLLSEPLLTDFAEMDFYSYGMGWFTETFRGHKMVEHGGNINGFTALVTMVPDQKLGIVSLVNFNDSFDTYATTYEIIDSYLGVTGGDWQNRLRGFVSEVFGSVVDQMKGMNGDPVPNTHPTHALAEYAGTYRNACYGDIVIAEKDGGLTFTYNKKVSPLTHFHYDTFRIDDAHALFNGMTFSFETGKNGKVADIRFGIVMNPAAKDEIFTKVEG